LPEINCGDKHSVYFVKLTLPMQYTENSRLFIDGMTPHHTIKHMQYSNGVTI